MTTTDNDRLDEILNNTPNRNRQRKTAPIQSENAEAITKLADALTQLTNALTEHNQQLATLIQKAVEGKPENLIPKAKNP